MKAAIITFSGNCDGPLYSFPGAHEMGAGYEEDIGKGVQEAVEKFAKWKESRQRQIIATSFRRGNDESRHITNQDFIIEVLYWEE